MLQATYMSTNKSSSQPTSGRKSGIMSKGDSRYRNPKSGVRYTAATAAAAATAGQKKEVWGVIIMMEEACRGSLGLKYSTMAETVEAAAVAGMVLKSRQQVHAATHPTWLCVSPLS
jgi:hypothetical protein